MRAQNEAVACMVTPNAVDAELATSLLGREGVRARAFASLHELSRELDETAGCIILVEEALVAEDIPALREALATLPAWSDVPLILVARDVAALAAIAAQAFPSSGNVTFLERPLNVHTLISAVVVALRATAHQRHVGELIAQRELAVRSRDEFLAMLAHELRNPLAPMRNSLYILRALDVQDPMLTKTLDILERQVDHVVRMVDDLMDVARLERGKLVLQKGHVDLNRSVAASVESCLLPAQQKGHRISLRLAQEALPVEADPVRLEQIVCNLVNNAAKFSPRPGEIRVATAADAGFAVVTVQDEGIGFDPAAAEHLFDPFMQVNPTLERSAGGLGMGLTIARRLAALHGGTVQASSEGPGKGSRFEVRIPLAAPADGLAKAPEPATERRRRRRIVVVEDNADIRETLRMLLVTIWGHEVTMAEDGPSGVALVLRERPEVALVDIGLPGMSGYDVARTLRGKFGREELRLIAVTGYGQPSDREAALQAGFDQHLLKPIRPQTLAQLLSD